MNRIRPVAAMFGKELGEEFKVKTTYGNIINCKFTKKGLKLYDTMLMDWRLCRSDLMQDLILGTAVIVHDD